MIMKNDNVFHDLVDQREQKTVNVGIPTLQTFNLRQVSLDTHSISTMMMEMDSVKCDLVVDPEVGVLYIYHQTGLEHSSFYRELIKQKGRAS